MATYAPLQPDSAPMTGAPSEVDGRKQACAMSSSALPRCVEMFRAIRCRIQPGLRHLTWHEQMSQVNARGSQAAAVNSLPIQQL